MTLHHTAHEPVEPPEIDQPWRRWATIVVISIVSLGTLCGLVLIPVVQGRTAGIDAWTAICRAVGIQAGSPAARQPSTDAPAAPTSDVAWTPEIMARLWSRTSATGKDTAEQCAACHGAQGISPDPQFPDLAGQSAFAIYKQLHDYKNGARVNEAMSAVVAGLTDEQMADIAVHWSAQSTGAGDPRSLRFGDDETRKLVEIGDVRRGIPACASCHGVDAGGPIETPTLAGQRAEYIAAQLNNFRSGARRNDIYHRMRSLSVKLTDDEIAKLARYYARPR